MTNNKFITLIAFGLLYLFLKFLLPFGNYILYPINLIVTFLHEFGHSFFAFITGGTVISIDVDSNGAGLATTSGGFRSLVILGGYIGSAIFGNLILYISLVKTKYSSFVIYFLSFLLIFTSIYWFSDLVSSIILILLGIGLILISKYTKYDAYFLQFIGVSSILFIINDFNVGPSSDIAHFSEIFIIIPQSIWMYIWLSIVLIITFFNLKFIFKKNIDKKNIYL